MVLFFCLTPQGERGRDGVDGRKGEPVSHPLTLMLTIPLYTDVLIFQNDELIVHSNMVCLCMM